VNAIKQLTRVCLRPVYRGVFRPLCLPLLRRLRTFLTAPHNEAISNHVRDLLDRLAATQGAVAALSTCVSLLQQAGGTIKPVYVGGERLLAPHPRVPFMYLDAKDPIITPRVLAGDWEPGVRRVLERLLKPGFVVVEAGANVGFHTLTMAALVCPGGRVVSFEANPRAFALLSDSITATGFRDVVTLHNKAVYHQRALLPFHLSTLNTTVGSSLFIDSGGAIVEVEAVPIGDVLRERNLRPDFVRLDVEGAEPNALAGMWHYLETIPHLKILFEFFPSMLQKNDYLPPREFIDRLAGIGMRFWDVADDGTLGKIEPDQMFERYSAAWGDIVAARALE
jgi:FkbM family methyltransferase